MKTILGLGCATILVGTLAAQAADSGNDLQKNQTTMNGQVMQNSGQAGSGAMNIRQGIQNQLQQAGYTDVSVTPSSFFIHAKDKQGHPVAMVIGPDTFTEVTELPAGNSASSGGSTAKSGGTAPASTP